MLAQSTTTLHHLLATAAARGCEAGGGGGNGGVAGGVAAVRSLAAAGCRRALTSSSRSARQMRWTFSRSAEPSDRRYLITLHTLPGWYSTIASGDSGSANSTPFGRMPHTMVVLMKSTRRSVTATEE